MRNTVPVFKTVGLVPRIHHASRAEKSSS